MVEEGEVFNVSCSNEHLSFNANKILFFQLYQKTIYNQCSMQSNSILSILHYNNILLTV